LKPEASTDILYVPGGTCGKTKRPSPSVVALKVKLFESSDILTVALDKAARLGSVMSPAIEPLVVCAATTVAIARARTKRELNLMILCISLSPCWYVTRARINARQRKERRQPSSALSG